MKNTTKRKRIGALAIVVGSILAVGVTSNEASAASSSTKLSVSVSDDDGGVTTSLFSGIRW
jgi:hypothetical protein